MPSDLDELVGLYRQEPTRELRNRVMEACLPMIEVLGAVVRRRLRGHVALELGDLVQDGTFGLLKALERFDPRRGVKFWTFAQGGVRGAMLDAVRRPDPAGRLSRMRAAQLDEAADRLRRDAGREPSEEEVALRAGMSGDVGRRTRRRVREAALKRLDAPLYVTDGGRRVTRGECLPDRRATAPDEAAQVADLWEIVMRALTRQERLLVLCYYREAMTMKEVGGVLGVCESRVSQMHSAALRRLRAALAGRREELVA